MSRHVFVDVFKHGGRALHVAIGQRAVALGLFLRGGNLGLHLLLCGLMLGLSIEGNVFYYKLRGFDVFEVIHLRLKRDREIIGFKQFLFKRGHTESNAGH